MDSPPESSLSGSNLRGHQGLCARLYFGTTIIADTEFEVMLAMQLARIVRLLRR
jgi:hypothetical protein